MIALVASALLALYVLLPVILFDKFAQPFVQLKRYERTKTEELVAGLAVVVFPFVVTFLLSHYFWFPGHEPFALTDAECATKIADYRTVFAGLYSDKFFSDNVDEFWSSLGRVLYHQWRFLSWSYGFLFLEIWLLRRLASQFGRFNQQQWFRKTFGRFLLQRVSEWQPLFTPFVFHPDENRRVEIDLMTTDRMLYRGVVESHFVNKDGSLRGLLLKDAKRFQYDKLLEERRAGKIQLTDKYWKAIPGANLYVPFDKVVTVNVRFELPEKETERLVKDAVAKIGVSNIHVAVSATLSTSATVIPGNLSKDRAPSPPEGQSN